jgi:hypothetical protein
MKKLTRIGIIIGGLILSFTLIDAQDIQRLREVKPQPEFRQEMVKLKYIDPEDLTSLLNPYRSVSGTIWAARDANKNNILIVRDTPGIVEKILSLIKDVDVKPADLLFTVQLVLGSESGEDKTDENLKNDPVIKEIKNLLKYRSFTLLDSNIIRTIEREASQITLGKNGEYSLYLKPRYIKDDKEENIQAEIQFGYNFSGQQRTNLIMSTLIIKPGEKTVVGVSKMQTPAAPQAGDRGLILVISGKILK